MSPETARPNAERAGAIDASAALERVRALGPTPIDNEAIARARGANAGILLIHGAGRHPATETLHKILEPTLQRLDDERQLVSVTPFQVGDPLQPGGSHDALLVEYTTARAPTRGAAARGEAVRKFVAVEGRWFDAYTPPGKKAVSIWFGRHAFSTCLGMLRHHMHQPALLLLASLMIVGLLGAAVFANWFSRIENGWTSEVTIDPWVHFCLLFGAAAIALAAGAFTSWRDVIKYDSKHNAGFNPSSNPFEVAVFLVVTASFYGMYQVQRALMIIASIIAVVALPVIAVVARIVGSIPILAGLSQNIVATAETAFMSSSPASLQAIADSHIAAGAIQRRMRDALFEMQSLLKDGATVSVLGYSTGGPVAWHLLSDNDVVGGECADRFDYRLLTIGAQLNWARGGYDSKATHLNRPLVNSVAARYMEATPVARPPGNGREPTLWMNLYGTMDPSPQGAVRPAEFEGWGADDEEGAQRPWWVAWDEQQDSPNRALTNLGSPLSGEHGEYFSNQQEFVPSLVRAIDEDIAWAAADADKGDSRRDLLSNVRIGIVAPLSRLRAIFFGLALFAVWTLLHGENLMTVPNPDPPEGYVKPAPGIWDNGWVQEQLEGLREFAEGRWFEGVLNGVFDTQWLLNTIVLVLFSLIIYAIVDGYTNFLWSSLGRAPRSWLSRNTGTNGDSRVPTMTIVNVWLPTLLAPIALLIFRNEFATNDLYTSAFWWTLWLVIAVNTIVAIAEIAFLRQCIRASHTATASVYRQSARFPTQESHQAFPPRAADGQSVAPQYAD